MSMDAPYSVVRNKSQNVYMASIGEQRGDYITPSRGAFFRRTENKRRLMSAPNGLKFGMTKSHSNCTRKRRKKKENNKNAKKNEKEQYRYLTFSYLALSLHCSRESIFLHGEIKSYFN